MMKILRIQWENFFFTWIWPSNLIWSPSSCGHFNGENDDKPYPLWTFKTFWILYDSPYHVSCCFFFLWVIFSVEIPSMGRLAFWDDFGGIYWGNSKRLSIQMQLQDAAGRFSGTVIKHGVLEKSPLNSVIVSISVLPVRDFWVNVGVEKTMPFVHMIFLNWTLGFPWFCYLQGLIIV